MIKTNWFVLYTTPRSEKKVKEQLENKGVECYLPLHRTPRVWSDRVKLVDIPLFSSYIFVRCKPFELFPISKLIGVVKVILYNGSPAVVRQSEIEAIKAFLEKAKERVLCTGDEVEILTGSMKHQSGKIIKIKKKYILLSIEQLTATVCVNTENVAPLKKIGQVAKK